LKFLEIYKVTAGTGLQWYLSKYFDSCFDIMFNKHQNFCRRYKKEIILFIFVFLVASISFGLGYLLASEFNQVPIIIEKYSSV
jgi:hypothetical protein